MNVYTLIIKQTKTMGLLTDVVVVVCNYTDYQIVSFLLTAFLVVVLALAGGDFVLFWQVFSKF